MEYLQGNQRYHCKQWNTDNREGEGEIELIQFGGSLGRLFPGTYIPWRFSGSPLKNLVNAPDITGLFILSSVGLPFSLAEIPTWQ